MAFQDASIERAPPGFVTSVTGRCISCRKHGTTGMRLFLTAFGAFALIALFVEIGEEGDSVAGTWFGFLVLMLFLLFSGIGLLWLTIGRTDFFLGADELTVEKRLLAWRRRRVFPRRALHGVRADRDGGRDARGEIDSFPSWGVVLEGAEHVAVIGKLERQQATWLGLALAKWADVPFHPAVDVKRF